MLITLAQRKPGKRYYDDSETELLLITLTTFTFKNDNQLFNTRRTATTMKDL